MRKRGRRRRRKKGGEDGRDDHLHSHGDHCNHSHHPLEPPPRSSHSLHEDEDEDEKDDEEDENEHHIDEREVGGRLSIWRREGSNQSIKYISNSFFRDQDVVRLRTDIIYEKLGEYLFSQLMECEVEDELVLILRFIFRKFKYIFIKAIYTFNLTLFHQLTVVESISKAKTQRAKKQQETIEKIQANA